MTRVLTSVKIGFKAATPLLAIFGISLVAGDATFDLHSLFETGLFVAGMIGVAAIMRSDVARLMRWKDKHDETHNKLIEILAELKENRKDMERRVSVLERNGTE